MRKLLLGAKPGKIASPDTMLTPSSLQPFVEYAKTLDLVRPAR